MDAGWPAAESSQDALERGAARRRQGRAAVRPTAHIPEASQPLARPPLRAVPEPQSPPQSVRETVDDSRWRARLESELTPIRAALAALASSIAADREARGAETEVSARWLAQLDSVESRLEGVEQQFAASLERQVGLSAHQLWNGGEPAPEYAQRLDVLEQEIGTLIQDQATLSETLTAVSQSLVARRLRMTTLSMGGIALALISAAVWLFTKGPIIF
jgi:hypothetical protein